MVKDKDLTFLENCHNEDLKTLADLLVFDPDSQTKRLTESLSLTSSYQENYPKKMKALIPQMVQELQLFGGNSVMNFFRGHGVSYREILCDVCDKLKVNYNRESVINRIEEQLLLKVLRDSVENMSVEEVKTVGGDLGAKNKDMLRHALVAGSPIYYRLVIVMVQNMIRRMGLRFAGRVFGQRMLAILSGPVGLIATSVWTIADIAGAAFRVTIPCVIMIAYMRATYNKPIALLTEV